VQNILSKWLEPKSVETHPYGNYQLIETKEKNPFPSQLIPLICEAMINARIDLGYYSTLAKQYSWSKLIQLLSGNVSPTFLPMQRGFFGEVLVCKMLEEFHGYHIPVQKWRYAITKNQSLTGTDALAIRVSNGKISEICFVETKLRTVTNKVAAAEGLNQLKSDYSKEIPDIILFVLNRLEERNDPLLPAFQSYFLNRKDMTDNECFYLGLIWETNVWTDEVLVNVKLNSDTVKLPRLTVNQTCIKDLASLIAMLYRKIGMVEPSDDE